MRGTHGVQRLWDLGLLAKDLAVAKRRRRTANAGVAHRHLVERLGALHGLPQKIGQILSLGELAPTETEACYTPLTEGEAVLPERVARSIVERQLGAPVAELFREFDGEGISASIGQVHRAVLLDGRKAAVKVQYPDIDKALRQDLRALGWLTAPVGGLIKRGFDLAAYKREVNRALSEELDYQHEAEMIRQFSAFTAGWDAVEVPEVVDTLSTGRVLTMTWVEGDPFPVTGSWPEDVRAEMGTLLLRFFLRGVLRWGHVHGDPHAGNFRFRIEDGKPVLGVLDFGCVKTLEDPVVDSLATLVALAKSGACRSDPEGVLAAYVGMGFQRDLLAPMADRLPSLTEILFEPFCARGPFSMGSWNLAERVADVLDEYRWNFRIAGPADLLFFVRAYQGLVQYLRALDAPVDWGMEFEKCWLERVTRAPITRPSPEPRSPMKSEKLCIKVMKGGETRVQLTFGAHVAENLGDLIPDDLLAGLRKRNIDVDAIAIEAVRSGFAPGRLFDLVDGDKRVRVWLE
ncbi:MAG: AarF/ABC1/UbiB kinase family protein [Gemmatimonadetes bacterium]|nr:AarF/ABC1/UbiB kinase family protein [Gemmatimonadota bacterium]